MKKPIRLLQTISVMLMAFAMLITTAMIGGCASGTSDRGNLGETAAAPMIQIGQIDNTGQPMPVVATDDSSFYAPGYEAVATELDAQIAAIQSAIEAASKGNDQETVATLSKKLATLQTMKSSVAAMKGGSAKNSLVFIGSLTLTTSGTASAASPGDTTQTPSTQTNPQGTLSVPLTP